jgi:plasmid stabilization system protein ParE
VVNRYSIYWTPEAQSDLKPIFEYISRAESCQRALYVIAGIRKKVKETAIFPTKHPKESFINQDNVRVAVKWSYKIVFEIKGNTVRVLSIFHTAQSPEKLMNL